MAMRPLTESRTPRLSRAFNSTTVLATDKSKTEDDVRRQDSNPKTR